MRVISGSVLSVAALAVSTAWAGTGKLALTGGVSTIDGAAGGGISPWAVIGTQATEGEVGVAVNASALPTKDYSHRSVSAIVGLYNRVELSLSQQSFDASPATALNGLGFSVQPGQHIRLNTVGAKLRVVGDAILDTLMPQVAVGLMAKRVDAGSINPVLSFLDADRSGVDVYVSATKLFLAQGLLANATLRSTRANQGGLLGFGAAAPGRSSRSVQAEFALARLISRTVAVGLEYRQMPNNLEALGNAAGLGSALRQDSWKDLFVAWAPNRNLSLTAAYVDLGRVVPGITGERRQRGIYVALQGAF
jgi:Protein of unknown function (DUF3034)